MNELPPPPRRVLIGDAAAFVGITPRTIRHYHQIGLLPERERGDDGRRRYGYEEIIQLLWIRRMAEVGVALDDIRDAFAGVAPSGCDGEDVGAVLARLEDALEAQEAELRARRAAVQRMRSLGSRRGLLDDLVSARLEEAPAGALRQDDLDTLLVTERIFGPLGAAIQAGRFRVLALHPELREESDRITEAEEALDDTVAVDDPRVAAVAAERHTFEAAVMRAAEKMGLQDEDDALLDAWDRRNTLEGVGVTQGADHARESGARRAADTIRSMPYDFSPARWRSMMLAVELGASTASDPDIMTL